MKSTINASNNRKYSFKEINMKTISIKAIPLHKQSGNSLLQMVGVIIVGAMLVAGSIAMWKQASSGTKESAATSQIIAIQMAYRGGYAGQSTYGTGDITNSKYLPSDLKITGTTATNAWNGSVLITGATSVFTETWGGIPDDSCSKIAITKSDWTVVTINGGAAQALPVTIAAANTACTGAANSNTIVFTSN